MATASMACFLLVETDLPELYVGAAAAYGMSNDALGTIFKALCCR